MMSRKVLPLAALAGALLVPAALHAQGVDRSATLREGKRSVVFGVSGGGGRLGYWWMTSEDSNVGIELGLSVLNQDDVTAWTISAGPALKRYISWETGPVAPFYFGGLNLVWTRSGGSASSIHLAGMSLRGGFGAEWFPARRFSIGAYAGLHVGYLHRWDDVPDGSGSDSYGRVDLSTMTSGLNFHIYIGGPDGADEPGVASGSR